MNATQQKYGDQGLVVLGVSQESRSTLEPFIERYSTEYPVVSSASGASIYGVTGYPTYYLVSATGRVLAGPTHGKFKSEQIEAALRSVVRFPEVAGSSKLAALRKAAAKTDVVGVVKALARLQQDNGLGDGEQQSVAAVRAALERIVKFTAEEIQELGKGPNYLAADQRLREICKTFKGLPIVADAEAELVRFKKDARIKKELTALKRLQALRKRYRPSKISDRRKLLKGLIKLRGKYGGTHAADKASELIQGLAR